jgi:hypothetical protein
MVPTKSISELCIGDVVQLPVYGRFKVIKAPYFNPAHNRQYVTLELKNEWRSLTLTCDREMRFDYVGFYFG